MTLGNQILMFHARKKRHVFFFINPRLVVRVWLEYARVNNAREVIPAARWSGL